MLRDVCAHVGILVYWCMSILNANENEILNKGESLRNMGNPTSTRRRGLHYRMIEIGDCATFSLPVLLGVV